VAAASVLAQNGPPTGHARWTLRLLAGKAVELGFCDSISHETIKEVLKKTGSNHYKRLVAPVQPYLKTRMVGIILHGFLHYLPFAALSDGWRYLDDTHYFLFT
jgi:CHAT domain-containing protein